MHTKQELLLKISSKFQSVGTRKGHELLVPISIALEILKDLDNAEIPIMGITVWQYVSLNNGEIGIAEDLRYNLTLPDDLTQQVSLAQKLLNELSSSVDLISFDLHSSYLWYEDS